LAKLPGEPASAERGDGSLRWSESVYREHPAVADIVAFDDRRGQLVALVISDEAREDELRRVLDEIARRRLPGRARIADFVSLTPDDPLVRALCPAEGPRRDVIWGLLVGCIEALTLAGHRFDVVPD
jgi:hypothetical protein